MGTLSNPSVEVNNDSILIIPNSTSYKGGKGDKKVRTQSAGGDSIETVVTDDAETKKSMVKFSLTNEKSNIDLVKQWQDSADGVSIRLSENDFTLAFRRMILINDPEIKLGADGDIELEFEGPPTK